MRSKLKFLYYVIMLLYILFIESISIIALQENIIETYQFLLMSLLLLVILIFFTYLLLYYLLEVSEEELIKKFKLPFINIEKKYKWKDLNYVYSFFPIWCPFKVYIVVFEDNSTIALGSIASNTKQILKFIRNKNGLKVFDSDLKNLLVKEE